MAKHGLVVNRMPAVDGRALSREELLKESTKMATYLQPRGTTLPPLTHSFNLIYSLIQVLLVVI